jgi:hypothetical protein
MTMMRGNMSQQITEAPMSKRGLWDNIHAKRKRGEKMRKKGAPGAPTDAAFKKAQGMKCGGMVKHKNGGMVMAGRGGGCKGTF